MNSLDEKPLGYVKFRLMLAQVIKTSEMFIHKKRNVYYVYNIEERSAGELEEFRAVARAYYDLF